jgi:hypothetical protein
MRRTKKAILPDDRGQSTVEFALTIVFVMVTVFWALEFLMFIYTYTVMADAAKEGVRYAVVHGCGNSTCSGTACPSPFPTCGDTTGANVIAQVKTYAKFCLHDISGINVSVNYPDSSAAAPSRVQVIIHYPYKPYFSLGWGPPTINAAAEGRIMN